MKILNFGSMNIDYVYNVDHIVSPGETIASSSLEVFPGGKGLNQSIALAKAGAHVFHAGFVGQDGEMLRSVCKESGVDVRYVHQTQERTGNAIIQVSAAGENSIVLFCGANRKFDPSFIDGVLADFGEGDLVLLQNEINLVDYIIERAYERGLKIAINPAPYDENIHKCDLHKVNIILLNEIEALQLSGLETSNMQEVLAALTARFPKAEIILTLGVEGAIYACGGNILTQKAFRIQTVDTTAAGDTFTGYFLAMRMVGKPVRESLEIAAKAAALAVSRKGATSSIPALEEVLKPGT